MKICFLGHNLKHDNGAGVFARHLIDGAEASGFDVVALVTEGGSGKPYERAILPKGRLKLLTRLFAIREVLKGADIIHALDLQPYGMIASLFSIGLRKKIIITAVGSGSIIPLYSGFRGFAERCYRRAARVTAISEFTKREIQKKVPRLMITVIQPGIDTAAWKLQAGQRDISIPQRYIVSVGSLRWRKGYRYSIEAFASLSREFADLEYVIVGKRYSDKMYRKITTLIKEKGLEKRIHIMDSVDDMEDLKYIYRNAEAFILLSQNEGHDVEGFGIVFLEAASQGLPVIGSRDCGVEDAVLDGKNGFLVGSQDVVLAAEKLRMILTNPNLRISMASASFSFVQKNDWKERIKAYQRLYTEIAVG